MSNAKEVLIIYGKLFVMKKNMVMNIDHLKKDHLINYLLVTNAY